MHLTFGKLDREFQEGSTGERRHRVFYDVGTELDFAIHPWFVVGIRPHRYGVFLFLGPFAVTFYHRPRGKGVLMPRLV